MNGVTTAIIVFIFGALAYPPLVKNRSQFYAALVAVLAIIFFDATAHMFDSVGFRNFAYCACGFLQIFAIVLIVLCAGGLSMRELTGELGGAIELIRRGESQKEVIVPLSAAAMRKTADEPARPKRNKYAEEEDGPREVFKLDDPAPAAPAPTPPPPDAGPLPLE